MSPYKATRPNSSTMIPEIRLIQDSTFPFIIFCNKLTPTLSINHQVAEPTATPFIKKDHPFE